MVRVTFEIEFALTLREQTLAEPRKSGKPRTLEQLTLSPRDGRPHGLITVGLLSQKIFKHFLSIFFCMF